MTTEAHHTAIIRIMRLFNLNYTGFMLDANDVKFDCWEHLLSRFEPEVILQAADHIIATRKSDYNWAPDPATVIEQCTLLTSGMLFAPTGAEAWEKVAKRISESTDAENVTVLDENIRKALAQTTPLSVLRRMEQKSIPMAMSKFVKAYDAIVERQRLEAQTPAAVKGFLEKRRAELQLTQGSPVPQIAEKVDADPAPMPRSEIRDLIAQLEEGMAVR